MRLRTAVVLFALVLVTACGRSETTDTDDQNSPTSPSTTAVSSTSSMAAPKPVTAAAVLAALKDAGLPIGEHIEYSAETDPNEQLGRPGGYTSKVNFHDTRLEQSDDFDTDSGGSIEVFTSGADAKRRYDYVDGITRGNALLNE